MTAQGERLRAGAVTVVTVYHNRPGGVIESLRSLQAQDYPDLDIVVVDDASSDDTADLIARTIKGDARAKLVRNKANKGFTRSLIEVLDEVDTEFVAIHGSGDLSGPDRISTQVAVMRRLPEVGVTAPAPARERAMVDAFPDTRDLMRKNRITHGAALFRMQAYRQVGGYRAFFTSRQDKDLWLRMSLNWKICVTPSSDIYHPVRQANSVSTNDHGAVLQSLLSNFAVDQIAKRMTTGRDDLDRYGAQGALIYDPRNAVPVLARSFLAHIRARQFRGALGYLRSIRKLAPTSPWGLAALLFLIPVVELADHVQSRLIPRAARNR